MEYEHDDETQDGSLMDRIKESPRTVSALIIILIVAAAIYAFSGDDTQQAEEITAEQAAAEQTEEQEGEAMAEGEVAGDEDAMEEGAEEESEGAMEEITAATPQPVDTEELAEQSQSLPEATKTESAYVEVAAAGDGVTHLARRAATRHLSENAPEYSVTNEHRVYIEDYIKDRIGSGSLSVGQEQSISFELIQEAVAAAGQLNANQLNNLTQYTPSLT